MALVRAVKAARQSSMSADSSGSAITGSEGGSNMTGSEGGSNVMAQGVGAGSRLGQDEV